ncbi:MAG TPA: NAD(P)H-binding protein [Chloroflexota bacterium]|nr:NAD(P)H-binding protein [Chloroflexota bacterium]
MTDSDAAEFGTYLVTGATGFVGAALVKALRSDGRRVRAMSRSREKLRHLEDIGVEVCEADSLQVETLPPVLEGCDVAYYLIHSMGNDSSGESFAERDLRSAENFAAAAASNGVRRLVYLGGMGERGAGQTGEALSEHLRSRIEVGRVLAAGDVPATLFRAAMIIGRGGASFEMLRTLVMRLPVMITPRWLETRTQPIALRDVISYLVAAGTRQDLAGEFDIGGPDVLSYREMMTRLARVAGVREPFVIKVPVLTPRLSALWVDLVTAQPPSLTHPLIEGLKNEMIGHTEAIKRLVPLDLTSFDDAVRLALKPDREPL